MKKITKEKITAILLSALFLFGFLIFTFSPHETYSNSERRFLASFPEVSKNTIISGRFMEQFEKYATDAVPKRDFFRSLKAITSISLFQRADNNGLYLVDGYLSKMEYPKKDAVIKKALDKFRLLTEKYLDKGNHAYLSIIPDKNAFLAKESAHLSFDYEKTEKEIEEMTDFASFLSISSLLEIEDYYKTDTHWRQEKIEKIAKKLADGMQVTLSDNYEKKLANSKFYGVYHGQMALPLPAEPLYFLESELLKNMKVFDVQNNKEIPVYEETLATGRDPYEMFLSGSLSLIKIENPLAKNEKKLVIFRDSFASSLAPLLFSGYSHITLVDIRYINSLRLEQFVDFKNSDILFLYSLLVLNNSETFK